MQDCKCGTEMKVVATNSRKPHAYDACHLEKPFSGSALWCPKCGSVCVRGELIGIPPEVLEPNWLVPQSEKELEDRRWIMAEIGGWNNCMDDARLAKAFLVAQEKLREVHRKHKTWKDNSEFGGEEC